MDNLRIIYGKSIENPWIIYGYSIVLFFVYTIFLISWLHWKHHTQNTNMWPPLLFVNVCVHDAKVGSQRQ